MNVTKVQSHVISVLHNVSMVPSNVRKKNIRELLNVTKVKSHVMLVLHNVKMILSNVRKNKETTKCDKSTITYDVGTAQYKDSIIKCEKKIRDLLNVTKVQSYMMLALDNMKMVSSNVRKNKGTIECDKTTIPYNVIITQYDNSVIKM